MFWVLLPLQVLMELSRSELDILDGERSAAKQAHAGLVYCMSAQHPSW